MSHRTSSSSSSFFSPYLPDHTQITQEPFIIILITQARYLQAIRTVIERGRRHPARRFPLPPDRSTPPVTLGFMTKTDTRHESIQGSQVLVNKWNESI